MVKYLKFKKRNGIYVVKALNNHTIGTIENILGTWMFIAEKYLEDWELLELYEKLKKLNK